MALEITDQTFDEVLGQNQYVVVDFWAAWCGPCRMIGPIIDELANDNSDVVVAKLNVSDNAFSAQKYMVTSIPCIIFFKDGQEVTRVKGAVPKSELQKKINELKG